MQEINKGRYTPQFREKSFTAPDLPLGTLAKKTIGLRLPVEHDRIVRSIPDMQVWLRRVVRDALIKDGLIGDR
jgi:hypothetical protein